MGFFLETQTGTAGKPLTFDYGDQGGLGRWVYGVSSFSLEEPSGLTTAISSLELSVTSQTNNQTGTITLTPRVSLNGVDVAGTSIAASVSLTVLAWIDPDAGSSNPATTPGSVTLAMALGLDASSIPDTSRYGLQGVPRVCCAALAGFELVFSPNSRSRVNGFGAAAGVTVNPYRSSSQAMPLSACQLIAGDNSGSGDWLQGPCTVDAGIVALSTTSSNVTAGFAQTHMSGSPVTLSPQLPSAWQNRTVTRVGVFVQSFYLQFVIGGQLVATIDVGASNIAPGAGGFSFTSRAQMTGGEMTVTSSARSYGVNYIYVALAGPVVASVTPTSGPAGTKVTVAGANLENVEMVRFGGVAAQSFTTDGNGGLTATAPAGGSGTVDVDVITSAGLSATTASCQYTYTS